MPSIPTSRHLKVWLDEAGRALERGTDEARRWLATPTGRRVRALAAQVLIVSAPFALRHPFFKTPVGRLIEVAGGAALLMKVAELIRDWEPAELGTVAS